MKAKEFKTKIGLISKIFGCWHNRRLSRPFFDDETGQSYRVCLDCGARKQFDSENLRTIGYFYFPSAKFPNRKI
jgi:hypothetical protein